MKKTNKQGQSQHTNQTQQAQQMQPKQPTQTNNTEVIDTDSMEIEIEKGIEVPPFRARAKYPFDRLQPGESFVIPKGVTGASVTVSYWKKKLKEEGNPNIDFTIRSLTKEEIERLAGSHKLSQSVQEASRVWRIDGLVVK